MPAFGSLRLGTGNVRQGPAQPCPGCAEGSGRAAEPEAWGRRSSYSSPLLDVHFWALSLTEPQRRGLTSNTLIAHYLFFLKLLTTIFSSSHLVALAPLRSPVHPQTKPGPVGRARALGGETTDTQGTTPELQCAWAISSTGKPLNHMSKCFAYTSSIN